MNGIESYTIYKCPICCSRYLQEKQAQECFEKCQKLYHKVYKITLTFDFSMNEAIKGESSIVEKELYLKDDDFRKCMNKVSVFYHYDKIDFSAYSNSNEPNENLKTITRIKKFVIEWLEKRIKFVDDFLGKTKD